MDDLSVVMLAAARERLGLQIEPRQGIFSALCNTREQYVKIGREEGPYSEPPNPGVLREGCQQRSYETEGQAGRSFVDAFLAYAKCWMQQNAGCDSAALYWRYDAPHIFMENEAGRVDLQDDPVGPFRVRCRLCLTNKPIVWKDQAAYDAAQIDRASAPTI